MKLTRLLVVSIFTFSAFGQPLTLQEKQSELNQLASLVRTQYGPYDYKIQNFKLSLDALVNRYFELSKNATNLEFYYLLNRFVAEFKDSHFSSLLDTDHVSFLGFFTDRVGGKILIDEIDRRVLADNKFPFQRGDEVVSIGTEPAENLVKYLSQHQGMGNEEAALRMASMLVAFRPAALVPAQYGKTKVTIRHGTSTIADTVELEWQQRGEPVFEDNPPKFAVSRPSPIDYGDLSVRDLYDLLPKPERSFMCAGVTRIRIPEGAVKLIEQPFVAYYHPTEKGKVGYLRIPHYSWNQKENDNQNDLRFDQYEWAIEQLEKNTVGLIIDQDHNCGGSVELLERMVSLFASKPFKGLAFQFLATRNEYLNFKSWMTGDALKTVSGQDLSEVLNLLKVAFMSGQRMTSKTTFHADRLIEPNRIRYSKPVLLLTDEMSGSGGDAFPAMMQGLGLAKIMGSRTMGAGGHVESRGGLLYYSGNKVRVTKSLFFHPNGTAIENNGVQPDYPYQPSRDDFLYEYRNYQKRYLDVLFSMITK